MDKCLELLLIEDTMADVRLCEEAVKDLCLHCKLHVIYDGQEALEFIHNLKSSDAPCPDVILLDLNLPKKSGHQILASIKEDADLKRIPVIVLTVSEREEDILKALQLRMDYYIRKPVTAQNLVGILKLIDHLNIS